MQFNYDYILVRYGELTTKGKNRNEFIKRLQSNIKSSLKSFENLTYDRTFDRLYIKLNGEDESKIIPILKKVYGLSSFSLASKVSSDIETIVDTAYQMVKNEDENLTFKVLCRRKDKMFPMSSDQVNRQVATKILQETNLKVDVRNYDLGIIIEINKEDTFVMARVHQGLKGLPVGISGKSLLLLSGGIDSPVAGDYLQKRGVFLEAIHFASPPYTSAESLDKVKRLARKLCVNQEYIKLYTIPFTKLQLEIHKNVPSSYEITILRRMMFRISEIIAKNNKNLALVTGESLGQVSSQTLENMSVINEVITTPVLRPLISMDKIEIIDRAKKIDTYDISIEPFDDACTIFNPKNPVIKPKSFLCERYEENLDYKQLLLECIENAEVEYLKIEDSSEYDQLF